mmetsp:Transcript_57549/g.160235  ORF Transcript_57549/g.160235 Transcript_57549/m.160235 type:complete len:205 (+) Transcript_57549:138-752(+)
MRRVERRVDVDFALVVDGNGACGPRQCSVGQTSLLPKQSVLLSADAAASASLRNRSSRSPKAAAPRSSAVRPRPRQVPATIACRGTRANGGAQKVPATGRWRRRHSPRHPPPTRTTRSREPPRATTNPASGAGCAPATQRRGPKHRTWADGQHRWLCYQHLCRRHRLLEAKQGQFSPTMDTRTCANLGCWRAAPPRTLQAWKAA